MTIKEKPIILNKDYLTRNEAQLYMGLSERGFDKLVKNYGIPSSKPPGCKIMFRRSDLQQLNETFFDKPELDLQTIN